MSPDAPTLVVVATDTPSPAPTDNPAPDPAPLATDTATPFSTDTLTPTDTPSPTETSTTTATATVVLPVPPYGTFDIQPETLVLSADPGRPDHSLASGTVVVHVSTNAAHGFVLRLVGTGLRTGAGRAAVPGPPRLRIRDADDPSARGFYVSTAQGQDLVLAESPVPVPVGQTVELRVTFECEADFTTSADSYDTLLQFDFEPRY
ncbi:MAG: hypothetical protein JO023_12280 [Chloroflexi bacterium]|nr:hypothetical protein [Chloroflexota bacterium]